MKNILESKNGILNSIIFCTAVLFIILRTLLSSGEISSDSIQYFLQAQNFWDYKVNFPLGYAFFINILHHFTGSFLIASKIINLLSYLAVIAFSYRKKFFFNETLFIFSFYPLINLYPASLSESFYYFFNYLIIYLTYRIIEKGFSRKYIYMMGILFFLLVSVRFSGIFVFAASLLFLSYTAYRKKYPLYRFALFASVSTAGVLSYLLINYLYCGYLLGQRDHLHISPPDFISFISETSLSAVRDFSFFNIFIHKGLLDNISFLHIGTGVMIVTAALFIVIKKGKKADLFSSYLFFSFLVISSGILYSYYTTKIDDTIRVKSNAYLYLMLFLIVNFSKSLVNYFRVFLIACLSFNVITLLKYSEKISVQIEKYNALSCNNSDKTLEIIYKSTDDYENKRNNSRILLFKAVLIDKGYKIYESDQPTQEKYSNCHVDASQITE